MPQCYLAGFVHNWGKKSQLYIVDSTVTEAFFTTLQNVAVEWDFDWIETGGEYLQLFGSSYAEFESKLGPGLVRTDAKGDFQNEADRAVILELVALLAVRNPGRSEVIRHFKEQATRSQMETAVGNRRRWESQKRKAAEAGVEGAADLTYEEITESVERGDYTIAVPTTGYVEQELKSLMTVYSSWIDVAGLLRGLRLDQVGFATSDRPVTLCWDDTEMEGGFYPPGFGLHGTSVFCPLSKSLSIRGRFDDRVGAIELPADAVAGINSRTIFYADRRNLRGE